MPRPASAMDSSPWCDGTHFTRPGKQTKNYGKSPFFMGKLTISMAIFNSYVKLPEGSSTDGNQLLRFVCHL